MVTRAVCFVSTQLTIDPTFKTKVGKEIQFLASLSLTNAEARSSIQEILGVSLPNTKADLEKVFKENPLLRSNPELAKYVIDSLRTGKPPTEEQHSQIVRLSVQAVEKAYAPIQNKQHELPKVLINASKADSEKVAAEIRARYKREILETTRDVSAAMEGLASFIGSADPSAALVIRRLENAASQIGTGIAMLASENPLGILPLMGGIASLASLGDDDPSVEAQRRVMEALVKIHQSIIDVHREVIQAREEINFLHRDSRAFFDAALGSLGRIESNVYIIYRSNSKSLEALMINAMATNDVLSRIEADQKWLQTFVVDTTELSRLKAMRDLVERETTRSIPPSPEKIEDALFDLYLYARDVTGMYNLNGQYFVPRQLLDPDQYEKLSRRGNFELWGFLPQLLDIPPDTFSKRNPQQLIAAANSYAQILALNWSELRDAKGRRNSTTFIDQLTALISTLEEMKATTGLLADDRLQLKHRHRYSEAVQNFVTAAKKQLQGDLPSESIRKEDGVTIFDPHSVLRRNPTTMPSYIVKETLPGGDYKIEVAPPKEVSPEIRLALDTWATLGREFEIKPGYDDKTKLRWSIHETVSLVPRDDLEESLKAQGWKPIVVYERKFTPDHPTILKKYSKDEDHPVPWDRMSSKHQLGEMWAGNYAGAARAMDFQLEISAKYWDKTADERQGELNSKQYLTMTDAERIKMIKEGLASIKRARDEAARLRAIKTSYREYIPSVPKLSVLFDTYADLTVHDDAVNEAKHRNSNYLEEKARKRIGKMLMPGTPAWTEVQPLLDQCTTESFAITRLLTILYLDGESAVKMFPSGDMIKSMFVKKEDAVEVKTVVRKLDELEALATLDHDSAPDLKRRPEIVPFLDYTIARLKSLLGTQQAEYALEKEKQKMLLGH